MGLSGNCGSHYGQLYVQQIKSCFRYFLQTGIEKADKKAHNKAIKRETGVNGMETGVVVAIAVVGFIAIFAVIICIVSAASSVSGIKHTNDEDTDS